MEPVELVQRARCSFTAKPCKTCGKPRSNKAHLKPEKGGDCEFKRQLGCAGCGRYKGDEAHFGEPPSFNVSAGRNPNVYRALLDQWKAIFTTLLLASDLPGDCSRIVVEGEAVFPTAKRRDQGNFRVITEKALGDALVDGGWLPNDEWDRYEFGNLTQRVQPGVSETRVILFPMFPAPEPVKPPA